MHKIEVRLLKCIAMLTSSNVIWHYCVKIGDNSNGRYKSNDKSRWVHKCLLTPWRTFSNDLASVLNFIICFRNASPLRALDIFALPNSNESGLDFNLYLTTKPHDIKMAESDLIVKTFVIRRVFPVCAVLIVLYVFKKNSKRINGIVSAYVLNRAVPSLNKATKGQKQKLFSGMWDQQRKLGRDLKILEIGAGSGANFQFYPSNSVVTCLDPNEYFHGYLEENSKKNGLSVNLLKGFAEKMEGVEDNTFDAVTCTLVLCTVRSVEKSLDEVQRVLKPVRILSVICDSLTVSVEAYTSSNNRF